MRGLLIVATLVPVGNCATAQSYGLPRACIPGTRRHLVQVGFGARRVGSLLSTGRLSTNVTLAYPSPLGLSREVLITSLTHTPTQGTA
jgi:hypothetical protein